MYVPEEVKSDFYTHADRRLSLRSRALRMWASGFEAWDLSLHVLPPNDRRACCCVDDGQARNLQAAVRDAARICVVGKGSANLLRTVRMFAELRTSQVPG